MLRLYIEAPFAACRTFTAGWYRPTAGFLTPSAAYGLLLNVAGIESRLREEDEGHDGRTPASLMRTDLPACKLALGIPTGAKRAGLGTVFQQVHNYPVGTSGKERAASTFGNKYNITPVRREFLTDLKVMVALDANPDFERSVRRGLNGEVNEKRYGLPFLGDNNFLPNRLEERPDQAAYWYLPVRDAAEEEPRRYTTRLSIWIDRADFSRTQSALFAPEEIARIEIPDVAWTPITPPAPEPIKQTTKRRGPS